MKALYIILLLIISFNLSANELQWVDEQINAIKPPRTGVNKSKINTTKDPFIFLKEDETKNEENTSTLTPTTINTKVLLSKKRTIKKRASIDLMAIFNKSALINNKWYKLGDKIDKYTISEIKQTTVVLKGKHTELLLSTQSKIKNLKIIRIK